MSNTFNNSLGERTCQELDDGFISARTIKMSSSVTSLKEDPFWLGTLMWAELHFKDRGELVLMSLILFFKKSSKKHCY